MRPGGARPEVWESPNVTNQPLETPEDLIRVLAAVRDLSGARTLEDVTRSVRVAARELAAADGITFVLRDGDHCYYADENAIAPLWRGCAFRRKTASPAGP